MYKYVGKGAYWPGVPMRDLSDDEWDSLPDGAKKGARALYKKLKEDRGKESEVKSNASNES